MVVHVDPLCQHLCFSAFLLAPGLLPAEGPCSSLIVLLAGNHVGSCTDLGFGLN